LYSPPATNTRPSANTADAKKVGAFVGPPDAAGNVGVVREAGDLVPATLGDGEAAPSAPRHFLDKPGCLERRGSDLEVRVSRA